MAFEEIFKFKINKDEIVESIKAVTNELENLEDTSKATADSVSKVSFNKPMKELKDLKSLIQTTFSKQGLDLSGFSNSIDEFLQDAPKMKAFIKEMKAGLGTLKGDEFKELAKNIDIAERELLKLEKAQQSSRKEFGNLRKATGDLNKEQLKQAGELKDKIGDQQQQIRILASDTKKLDFGIEAVSLAANGYQALTGAMQLFGVENEDALKSIQKLQSIMAITNALREIQNSLLKEGTLITLGSAFATDIATKAQAYYRLATMASTASMTSFKIALAGTGIGLLVVALGFAIAKWYEYSQATDKANEKLKKQREFNKEIAEGSAGEVTRLSILKSAVEDETLSREKRLTAVKSLQKEFPTYFAGLSQEAILTGQVGDAYDKTTKAILRKARANVAQKELEKIIEEELKAELNALNEKNKPKVKEADFSPSQQKALNDQKKIFEATGVVIKEGYQKRKDFLLKTINDGTEVELKAEKTKTEKVAKAGTDNRLKLLEDARKKELELQKQHDDLLNSLLNESNDEIYKNNVDASKNRLGLVTDEYAKQRAEIDKNFDIQSQVLLDKTTELQSKLRLQLSDPRTKQSDKAEIKSTIESIQLSYETLQTTLENERGIKLANLEFDHFNNTLKELKDNAENLGIQLETSHLTEILNLNQTYNNGAISYEDYQKKLTTLNDDYNKKRLQATKDSLLKELAEVQNKILGGGLNDKQSKELQDRKTKLKNDIAKVDNDLTTPKTDNKKKTELETYTNFYNNILNTALSTYNQILEAEQKALDKSIAIQERRMERAQRLAERGNTEYLELEEQRLTELEQKREASARRQLQINQAVQASNILMAVSGAVAKIGQGGSTSEVLGAIATIIGALGTGAVLVAQNNASQPSFYVGSDNIEGAKTSPKNINVHGSEAVIQDHDGTATKYRPTLKAIRRNLLPAGFLNMISTNALNGKTLNYDAINGATNVYNEKKNISINLQSLENKFDLLATAIEGIKMNVSYDKKGLASSLEIEVERLKRMRNA